MTTNLYPVILYVPDSIKSLKGREKHSRLSRFSRETLLCSAEKSGFQIETFEKDGKGIPVPRNGIYWSVSHKPGAVCGVVSDCRIGIDIEKIKKISSPLFKKIVNPGEKELFPEQDESLVFFRCFTAKEAVLKNTGVGMKGLNSARVVEVVDKTHLKMEYLDHKYMVEHFYLEGYLASITADDACVHWVVDNTNFQGELI